ncbi:hypothetical protein [Longimonas halophila]|uniref:hypothetical protein n=1 Tax=Longimonas halophila TaxID=1469170 RepID=UPI0015964259|nr:hypothetical protein [Longimonas halophila]
MTTKKIIDELTDVAKRMDMEVRVEKGDFRGGRCHVGGQTVIMLNKRHPTEVQLAVLARSLRNEPLETVYLKPAVREALHRLWQEADGDDGDANNSADSESSEDTSTAESNSPESPRAHAS